MTRKRYKRHINILKRWKWYNINRKMGYSKKMFKIKEKSAPKMDFINHNDDYSYCLVYKSRLLHESYYVFDC